MSSSPPDGLTVRAATLDDVEAAAAIVHAEEAALRGKSDFGRADLVDFWRASNLGDASLVVERDRIPVGFAAGIERDAESMYWITVHPEMSGRGLSTWLLTRGEERAVVASSRTLRVGAMGENAAARRLFADRGYREARHYFTMRISLAHELETPVWPDGIGVATFRPEDARAVHAALNEAFAEEWGSQALLVARTTATAAVGSARSACASRGVGEELAGRCSSTRLVSSAGAATPTWGSASMPRIRPVRRDSTNRSECA